MESYARTCQNIPRSITQLSISNKWSFAPNTVSTLPLIYIMLGSSANVTSQKYFQNIFQVQYHIKNYARACQSTLLNITLLFNFTEWIFAPKTVSTLPLIYIMLGSSAHVTSQKYFQNRFHAQYYMESYARTCQSTLLNITLLFFSYEWSFAQKTAPELTLIYLNICPATM